MDGFAAAILQQGKKGQENHREHTPVILELRGKHQQSPATETPLHENE
jgi:hypothetical protein